MKIIGIIHSCMCCLCYGYWVGGRCAEDIEVDMELLGACGIEDELQDGVPECIDTLHKVCVCHCIHVNMFVCEYVFLCAYIGRKLLNSHSYLCLSNCLSMYACMCVRVRLD